MRNEWEGDVHDFVFPKRIVKEELDVVEDIDDKNFVTLLTGSDFLPEFDVCQELEIGDGDETTIALLLENNKEVEVGLHYKI